MSRHMKLFNSVCDVKIMHYSTPKEIKNSQFHPDLKNKWCPDNLLSQLLKPNIFSFPFFFFFFLPSLLPSLSSNEYLSAPCGQGSFIYTLFLLGTGCPDGGPVDFWYCQSWHCWVDGRYFVKRRLWKQHPNSILNLTDAFGFQRSFSISFDPRKKHVRWGGGTIPIFRWKTASKKLGIMVTHLAGDRAVSPSIPESPSR